MIMSALGETLVANRLATTIFGDRPALTGWRPLRGLPLVHRSLDAERLPAGIPRQARPWSGGEPADRPTGHSVSAARAGELVRLLLARSEEFRELWERHEVTHRYEDHKTLLHPQVGRIDVDCQVLSTQDQGQALLVLTPVPGSEAEEKIRLLAVLGHEEFSAP